MKSTVLKIPIVLCLIAIAAGLVTAAAIYQHSQSAIADLQKPVATIAADPLPQQVLIAPASQPDDDGTAVRCAVINGMNITGFWKAVTDRFTRDTGIRVVTVAFGEKATIDNTFRNGGVDLLTMHACDKVINLVADGLAYGARPWARNDLIIVGPPGDPAHIKGLTDAAEAFRRIAATRSHLVVHASLGAQDVMRAIVDAGNIQFDPATVTMLFEDPNREVLQTAASKNAYTLIGRIPFRIGRLPNAGLELMVEGDPRLRRPYVAVVANPANVKGARFKRAELLADYLSSPQTQAWIATWGIGQLDQRPVFFPVTPKP